MGDFPTHNCRVMHDGQQLAVVSPIHQLDCDQRYCKSRADQAELAADMYTLDYIQSRIDQAQATVRLGMDQVATWKLYRDAKQRRLT